MCNEHREEGMNKKQEKHTQHNNEVIHTLDSARLRQANDAAVAAATAAL